MKLIDIVGPDLLPKLIRGEIHFAQSLVSAIERKIKALRAIRSHRWTCSPPVVLR